MNKACPAKSSKKLLHYVKTMKIMGLGEKTLEKLKIDSIPNLYELSEFELIEKLGEKIGTKIHNEIKKSTKSSISKFLASMSIPLIGKTAAEKIQPNISNLEELNVEACKKSGLGPKATENLMNWYTQEYENYKTMPIEFEELEEVESGKVVCISGKVPGYTKATIKELLADFNVKVVDSVTKSLDYLITEETNTSKVKKAEQYNINIISFDKFMEIIENE
jgi:DNA ligase (NAD+)